MAVTVIVRAKLKGDRASIQAIHDSVTGATKEMALQAGDVSHQTFLSSTNLRGSAQTPRSRSSSPRCSRACRR